MSDTESSLYLVAVDDTDLADHVVDVAAKLAERIGADVHIVSVVEPPTTVSPRGDLLAPLAAMSHDREELLTRLSLDARQRTARRVTWEVLTGQPWRKIVRAAEGLSADLLVVGTSGKDGLRRLVLGSVAEHVVRKAPCPVLVARRKEAHAGVAIEGPCPACLAAREASKGAQMWCERHATHHAAGHTYRETPPSFGVGSMLFRPEE